MKQNLEGGLTSKEVKKLQRKYGKNEIKEKKYFAWLSFLKKFINPIPLMIEIALLLSAISSRWEDFYIIAVLLAVNIGIEFIQEQKANKALQSLKKTLAPVAVVIRDGMTKVINAKELVPGDLVKISIGDVVPADMVIIKETYLLVNQATITGESLPVEKNKNDLLYASTIVQKGVAYARVTAIGKNTFIGKSATLVEKASQEKESHFQKAIFGIGKFLIIFSIILIVIVFVDLILRGDSLIETIRFSLVLAIASIPVALPTVLSVTMAIGANELARNKSIVSNFKAIEEMAGVDELCVDKTGTLTKNKIEVENPKVFYEYQEVILFKYALLLSNREHTSPIEKAIYKYAKENNFLIKENDYQIKKFVPFDPVRKMTESIVKEKKQTIKIAMGAPQVMERMITNEKDRREIIKSVEDYAQKGLRVVVVVKKEIKRYVPVGIIPFIDPPRKDSKVVIQEIKKRGIEVKMLTGDHIAIAMYIAKIVGLTGKIMEKTDLNKAWRKIKKKNVTEKIKETNIFAEVTPEDKYQIVGALQKRNCIVSMTGDGVNDSPALKKADIGIAVSGSSPAAYYAADLVLLNNGLSVIKKAIDLSRMTFSRMESYATFRISETMRIVLFVFLSVLIFNYTPISAVMIILLALLNDIPVMAIAYDNAPIDKKPVRWHLKETIIISFILGTAGLISSFGLFYWLNLEGYSKEIIQTILFLKLDVAGHSTLYLTRTGRNHFWKRPYPSLKFFLPAFLSRIIGTIIALMGIFMQAISWKMVIYIWIYVTLWFFFNDQIKVIGYRWLDKYKVHLDAKKK